MATLTGESPRTAENETYRTVQKDNSSVGMHWAVLAYNAVRQGPGMVYKKRARANVKNLTGAIAQNSTLITAVCSDLSGDLASKTR